MDNAPKPPHDSLGAFTAEAIMTFLMMAITLFAITNRKWESKVAGMSGLLIMVYIDASSESAIATERPPRNPPQVSSTKNRIDRDVFLTNVRSHTSIPPPSFRY